MSLIQGTGGGLGGAGAPGGALGSFYSHTIDQSLRFNNDDTAYLEFTPSSGGNRDTWTISMWVKRSGLGLTQSKLFAAGSSFASNHNNSFYMWFQSDDTMQIYNESGGSYFTRLETTRKFRDVSSWYHIVYVYDSTQATTTDRQELYINGVKETDFDLRTDPGLNVDSQVNATHVHRLGASTIGNTFDGYMAEVHFVDGTALDADDFGETKDGVWIAKAYSGSYGTNGFHLDFSSASYTDNGSDPDVFADQAGSNNFNAYNIAAYDIVPDNPTKNYCTMNPLVTTYMGAHISFAEGNLKSQNSTVHKSTWATFAITSGKWYWEALSAGGNKFTIGLSDAKNTGYEQDGGTNNIVGYTPSSSYSFGDAVGLYAGTLRKNGSTVASSLGYATNDKMGIAFDADAGKVWFHRNGTWFNGSGTDSTTLDLNNHDTTATTGEAYVPVFSLETPTTWLANFGQDGTFATGSGGGNSDDNGEGDFFYAVPSGFLALNSDNLEDVTISPGQSSQADDFFNTVLWSGNSTNSRSITTGFETDLVWIKKRGTTVQSHVLADSVRGTSDNSGTGNVGILTPNSTAAVSTNSSDSGIASFDSTGFTIGAGSNTANADAPYQGTNASGHTYVGWSWKAGGATPTKTYKVVVDNDGANKYRFRNSADDATFATYAPTVTLQEGGTYVFDWSDDGTNGAVSAQGHPIRFSTTSDGTHGGGTKYTTGVVEDDSAYTTTITVAASAPTLYYYCANHSGMGGQINTNSTFGSTNFDGSLQNVVSANKEAGFSIVTWTAPNDNGTLGHGLDSAPEWILAKPLGSGTNWYVMHTPDGVVPANEVLNLDSTAAKFNPGVNHFNDTYPTSTVFSYGGYLGDDLSNDDKVAYLWHSVEGYSKVGLYKGNANNYDDGIFVYTGFRPALVTLKSVGAGAWVVTDNKRSSAYNGATARLYWSETAVETAYNTNRNVELFSNGFMVHGNSASSNTNKVNEAQNYIYLAFAETPFKFANAR